MDELDVRILRALISQSGIAQSTAVVKSSLKEIADRLGADDMTVYNRYKKLQESGSMSKWQIFVNPTFFGYGALDVMVCVQPESGKADMIRKIRLIQGVFAVLNFHGKALKIIMLYEGEESRSRTVELISRITNAERITSSRMVVPTSKTERLTDTDIAIIRALSRDARKSSVLVAKELGLSSRTVRNRVEKLRRENTLFALPNLNLGGIPGSIPVYLSYIYSNKEAKGSVDREVLSHFDANYLWGGFSDPERGFVMLSAPTMVDVQKFLDWTRELPGVASAEVDLPTELVSLPDRIRELLDLRRPERTHPRRSSMPRVTS